MRTTANTAIKGRAAKLSVSNFIRDRETVERELFQAVKERLEGMNMKEDKLDSAIWPHSHFFIAQTMSV